MRKTNQHIIPPWLLELTGDPKRSIQMGFDWRRRPLRKRHFNYSAFASPACAQCNEAFSDLEGQAKQVIIDMLAGRPVAVVEDADCGRPWAQ